MDITGTCGIYLKDTVEIKAGKNIGKKGEITSYRHGKIYIETLSGKMYETEARCVQFLERPPQVLTQ